MTRLQTDYLQTTQLMAFPFQPKLISHTIPEPNTKLAFCRDTWLHCIIITHVNKQLDNDANITIIPKWPNTNGWLKCGLQCSQAQLHKAVIGKLVTIKAKTRRPQWLKTHSKLHQTNCFNLKPVACCVWRKWRNRGIWRTVTTIKYPSLLVGDEASNRLI